MTERTNDPDMKYCGDCVCFDNKVELECRAYGNNADTNHTACLTPSKLKSGYLYGRKDNDVEYNTYPNVGKCSTCKNPCEKRLNETT